MKFVLLASAVSIGLVTTANAASITASQITKTSILPSFASIITPVPVAPSTGFSFSTADVFNGGGTLIARSPFESVSGYTNANFDYVLAGGSATFTAAANPTFVTGGDTFSFIFGSPDAYNSISFSNGQVLTGSTITTSFPTTTPAATGYYVTTISGLKSYDAVTFSSSQNSIEFATYNVSSVPLPASLPMFGGALLALGGLAMLKKRGGKSVVAA